MNENPYQSPAGPRDQLQLGNTRRRYTTPVWLDWLLVIFMIALLVAVYVKTFS